MHSICQVLRYRVEKEIDIHCVPIMYQVTYTLGHQCLLEALERMARPLKAHTVSGIISLQWSVDHPLSNGTSEKCRFLASLWTCTKGISQADTLQRWPFDTPVPQGAFDINLQPLR